MAKKRRHQTQKRHFWQDDLNLKATGLLVLIIFVLLLAVGTAFAFNQNEERERKLAEGQALQAELMQLMDEAEALNQLEAMSGQPQYIERMARDELGMVSSDEIVFRDVE